MLLPISTIKSLILKDLRNLQSASKVVLGFAVTNLQSASKVVLAIMFSICLISVGAGACEDGSNDSDHTDHSHNALSAGVAFFSQHLAIKNAGVSEHYLASMTGYEIGYEYQFSDLNLKLGILHGQGSLVTRFSSLSYSTFDSKWQITAMQFAFKLWQNQKNKIYFSVTPGVQKISLSQPPLSEEDLDLSNQPFQRVGLIYRAEISEYHFFDFEIANVSPFNKALWKLQMGLMF
jgi:hypothetical protein